MAKVKDIEKAASEIAEKIAEEAGCQLVDAEYVKEGPNKYLRLYVDKEGGVTIDDCENISRSMEKVLDEKDFIEDAYILEVSSPGIDRPLKKKEDFEKYKGELVDVKLYKALNGRKEYQGTLEGLTDDDTVIISGEDGTRYEFSRKETASVRLAVIF